MSLETRRDGLRSAQLGALTLTAGYRPVYRPLADRLELACLQGVAAASIDGDTIMGRRLAGRIRPEHRARARALSLTLQAENLPAAGVGECDLILDLDESDDPDAIAAQVCADDTGGPRGARLLLGLMTRGAPAPERLYAFAMACQRHRCGAVLDLPSYTMLAADGVELPPRLIVRIAARIHRHLVSEPATARLFERLRHELAVDSVALLIEGIDNDRDLAAALASNADYCSGDHLGSPRAAGLARSILPFGFRAAS